MSAQYAGLLRWDGIADGNKRPDCCEPILNSQDTGLSENLMDYEACMHQVTCFPVQRIGFNDC